MNLVNIVLLLLIINIMETKQSKSVLIQIDKVWQGTEQDEGDGARVVRVIGTNKMGQIDPFLMLDYYKVKLPAGFPDHPHRGFETITYQKQGIMYHEDFKGHKGAIGPGDIQWMTAGKGIVHAEMPGSFTEFTMGFQLWLNLSKENKMMQPGYQEFSSEKIPIVKDEKTGNSVKIINGSYKDVVGPCKSRTPASYYDITINSNSEIEINLGKDKNGIIFVYEGFAFVNEIEVGLNCAGRFSSEKAEIIKINTKNSNTKFILISAKPHNEPISQRGPFVMNTYSEIQQAFNDYTQATNGFEGADIWESEIKNLRNKKKGDF